MHIIINPKPKGRTGKTTTFNALASGFLTFWLSLATAAVAEDGLTAIAPPAERAYSYNILGLQPGDPLEDVLTVYAERSDDAPTSEREVVRVQSPEGNVFEFTYQLFTRIGDVGINGRLAGVAQDQITARLASDVMEQRPLAIYRSIRQPSEELPEPLELQAQLEELYGPASRVTIAGREMAMLYAWSEDGFISDLDALGPLTHEETRTSGNRTSTLSTQYEICGTAQHYTNTVDYRFRYPREKEIRPGCIATFTVTHKGEPGMTSISFELVDYELGRLHEQELDRQIVEVLTSGEVKASDMDL
ncbi:hypothetical protein [Phaeobacter sp. NW0010-22]|uniref:hypothetical protein n=1 Tax=Phaeobacter sp. NW0010-22 TaxID=3135907 RepID=UPI00310976E5